MVVGIMVEEIVFALVEVVGEGVGVEVVGGKFLMRFGILRRLEVSLVLGVLVVTYVMVTLVLSVLMLTV